MRKLKCIRCLKYFTLNPNKYSRYCSEACESNQPIEVKTTTVDVPTDLIPNRCSNFGCKNPAKKNKPLCGLCRRKNKKSTRLREFLKQDKKIKELHGKVRKLSVKEYQNGKGFYETKEWRILRFKAIQQYGRTCMACGAVKGVMHVDHIKPRSKYPELQLDFNNLQILCEDCNLGKLNIYETDFRQNSLIKNES